MCKSVLLAIAFDYLFRNFSHTCTKRCKCRDRGEARLIASHAKAISSHIDCRQKGRTTQVCHRCEKASAGLTHTTRRVDQANQSTSDRISITRCAFTPQHYIRTLVDVVSCCLLTFLALLLYRSSKGVPMHYLFSRIVSAWYSISPILEQVCRLIDTFATCRNLIRSITEKGRSRSACSANECQKLDNSLPVSRSGNF